MQNLKEYLRPSSAEEAVARKAEYGACARYLVGGSDLLVHRPTEVTVAIDIRHAGLNDVGFEGDETVIGGAATLRDAETVLSDVAGGMLREALRNTAPWLVRNAASVAGNIANASPAADAIPALLALDAVLVLQGGNGEERTTMEKIFLGPHRTSLGDRLIRQIRLPAEARRRRAAFIKLSRSKSDIAQVNVAVSLVEDGETVRDARIALGAVAPTAIRLREAEELLEGKRVDGSLLSELEQAVAEGVRPIDDWRASAAYRRRMSGVLARRALERALGTARTGDE